MNERIVEDSLSAAVIDAQGNDELLEHMNNVIKDLNNVVVDSFTLSRVDNEITCKVVFKFKPDLSSWNDLFNGFDNVSDDMLKKFYNMYCDALVGGRLLLIKFGVISFIGGYEIFFTNDIDDFPIMEELGNIINFNVSVVSEIIVDFDDVYPFG